MLNRKIEQASDTLDRALEGYPDSADVESITIVAGIRLEGRSDPAVVIATDHGDGAIPNGSINRGVNRVVDPPHSYPPG